jgi:H+/Cl- antiporter ClcA/predicted transcriptional regulator
LTLKHLWEGVGYSEDDPEKRDYTTPKRMILISLIAMAIGVSAAFVALILLRLIGIFTNLFFFQRFNTNITPLGNEHIGLWVLVVPVVGGLVVGLMARYGSDRIRGHGIPEAIESILINGSKVQPRVLLLKPLASAIAIGSGGPFGAEGPIIVSGGAIGSIIAQFIHLSASERKTLLVAGAAAGMSATFAAPVASVMLAVELLLFEWKPRSLIPVALARAMAALLRHYLLGAGPIFPVPPHADFVGPLGLLGCVLIGLAAGGAAILLTEALYASEDGFNRLHIHWMWWPALGGLVIGIGGYIFPEALGVGYSTIGDLLSGSNSVHLVLGVLLVKSSIWVVSLASGTSGGILAPLLMIGAALGAVMAGILPNEGVGFWPLIAMAAILGATTGSPLTGMIFALELTHDVNALLPLLVGVMVAHGVTVLTLRRSILTEKIARRGLHLGREYAVDPLEIVLVTEVMRSKIVALPAEETLGELATGLRLEHQPSGQRLYPVIDSENRLNGVVSRNDLQAALDRAQNGGGKRRIREIASRPVVVCYEDEPLRVVAFRMAEKSVTRMPVVDREHPLQVAGMVSLTDCLTARARVLDEERHRERVLRTRMLFPSRRKVVAKP